MRNQSGFTLIEAMIVIAVIGIMTAVAVASSLSYLPDMRLKAAARDLHSNLQKAKRLAAKTNTPHGVFFNTAIGDYRILTDPGPDGNWWTGDDTNNHPGPDGDYTTLGDNIPEPMPIILANYKSGVAYGHGNATINVQGGGGFPVSDVGHPSNPFIPNSFLVVFDSRGMRLEPPPPGD